MSNGKLVYKCEWIDGSIKPVKVYRRPNGKIIIIGGKDGYKSSYETTLLYILSEISCAFNSIYGKTKKVYINTEEFKKMYGSDNIHKILKSKGFL